MFVDPHKEPYQIPIGLVSTSGHSIDEISYLTWKLLFVYGFSSKDLCTSVNHNTNRAILAGQYIVGNDKAGKSEMHKAKLILKHATGLATWKKKGQIVDSNPTFVKIYKSFYNFGAWLMSLRKCQ